MRCQQCGHDNSDNAKFCNQCAHPIAVSLELEGERKLVSVLFADMKSSMALLAGLDPEEAQTILDPILRLMIAAVHHHAGTVNQVMGDGIMALFGAPIAQEDHALRACCAALRMQAAVARHVVALPPAGAAQVQIRVGIHSGEVVVRSIDSGLHMDYSAVGQTTHLAARMEQMARPGTILITAQTLALARGVLRARPLGPVQVSGLREAVVAHELVGVRFEHRRPKPASSGPARFVGRESEMAALELALDSARRGEGQMLTVVGEAGVGKSRLLREFVHSDASHGCVVLEAGCTSYAEAKGYLAIIDLLRRHFAVDEHDGASSVRQRVSSRLSTLGLALDPSQLALWALLDVLPLNSAWKRLELGQRRKAIIDAVGDLVLQECRHQPLVLVIEDLHRIDAESQAVLDALVERLAGARLLLLASSRPRAGPSPPVRSLDLPWTLDPLPRASAELLVELLLGDASELSSLRRQLVERTEGNPLFIEECVSALAEDGALAGERGRYRSAREARTLTVPASVQAILAARIDGLAPGDKHVLQAAAVVGREVSYALLRHVAGLDEETLRSRLGRLEAGGFLHVAAPFPELRHRFKHGLTHEVGYASLLGIRRRELHARVVAAIEDVYPDRIGEHLERLAHHALRGDLKDKAVGYLNDAAGKAMTRSAHLDAIDLLEQALQLLDSLPEMPARLDTGLKLRLQLGPLLTESGGDWSREVETCWLRALELCDRLGQSAGRFAVVQGLWACHNSRGQYEQAAAWAARLLEQANDGDGTRQLQARSAALSTAVASGWPAQALGSVGSAVLSHKHRWRAARIDDAGELPWHELAAVGSWLLGRYDQAREGVVRGVAMARQTGLSSATALANYVAAVVHYHRGERGAAMLHARVAAGLGRAYGAMNWPEHAQLIIARLLADEGRLDEAVRLADTSLPRALEAGWSWMASVSFGLAADIQGCAGHPGKGLEMLRELGPQRYVGLYGPELHRLCAVLLLAGTPQADDETEVHLRRAVALARERRMRALELRAAISLAQLLTPRDRRAARSVLSVVDDIAEGADVADVRTATALRDWLR